MKHSLGVPLWAKQKPHVPQLEAGQMDALRLSAVLATSFVLRLTACCKSPPVGGRRPLFSVNLTDIDVTFG